MLIGFYFEERTLSWDCLQNSFYEKYNLNIKVIKIAVKSISYDFHKMSSCDTKN